MNEERTEASGDKPKFEKGDRVAIEGGKALIGARGEIFWTGPNKYGPGFRYGLRGDDGQTHWADEADLVPEKEATTEAPEPLTDDGPVLERGDQAKIVSGPEGVGARGEIFWAGKSKFGPGMRYGLKDAEGNTIWVDGPHVEKIEGAAPVEAKRDDASDFTDDPAAFSDDAPPPPASPDFDDAPPPGDDDFIPEVDDEDVPF